MAEISDIEFKATAKQLEKFFGEQVLPKPSPAFIKEQERRESLASASFFLQVAHGIGMVITYFMFFVLAVYSYSFPDDVEAISTTVLAFGIISLFYAYLISPLNISTLKPSEIPMDPDFFRAITTGRST